jgi:hypothetical protein
VKVCSLYGVCFYFIPGTDGCLRIGGAIRPDTAFNGTTYGVSCGGDREMHTSLGPAAFRIQRVLKIGLGRFLLLSRANARVASHAS